MTATSATPPASPSRPSIRFIALMTPTIQSIVNGRLGPAERDRLAERVGEHVDAEAEPVQQPGHRELHHELLPGVGAAQVVVEAEQRDGERRPRTDR